MAEPEYLQPIEDYVAVQWNNYLPPSIDQDNLNHLEQNVLLNRDTINEIIRKMGIKPDEITIEDAKIYENPIYETLIAHKNELERLERDKLDLAKYNEDLGDITQLQGGSTLVEAINNRIRRDIDDTALHTYTFKKLILSSDGEALNAIGTGVLTGRLTVGGVTSSEVIKANAGIETTTLKTTGAATFGSTVDATGKITGNGGLEITNGANLKGTVTVDNLIVTGTIQCTGNATFSNNVGAKTITTSSTITSDADIRTRGAFRSTQEYIQFHWNASPTHTLYVHGGSQGLGGGDAFIQTVT